MELVWNAQSRGYSIVWSCNRARARSRVGTTLTLIMYFNGGGGGGGGNEKAGDTFDR